LDKQLIFFHCSLSHFCIDFSRRFFWACHRFASSGSAIYSPRCEIRRWKCNYVSSGRAAASRRRACSGLGYSPRCGIPHACGPSSSLTQNKNYTESVGETVEPLFHRFIVSSFCRFVVLSFCRFVVGALCRCVVVSLYLYLYLYLYFPRLNSPLSKMHDTNENRDSLAFINANPTSSINGNLNNNGQ